MISTEAKIFLLALGGGIVMIVGVLAGFMPPTEIRDFLLGFAGNILASLVGVLFAFLVWDRYINPSLYGGSTVRVIWNGYEFAPRQISWRTAKEIADDDSDLSVFLKGIVSPYLWLNCDLVSSARMLTRHEERQNWFGRRFDYTITLDHNPPTLLDKDWRFCLVENLGGTPLLNIALRPEIVAAVRNREDDYWPFLAQLAAPFGLLDVAGVQDAVERKQLTVNRDDKIVTLSLNPPPLQEPLPDGLIVVNFAHPLTQQQREQIARLSGQAVAEVRADPTQAQIAEARPLAPQARAIVDRIGLTRDQWQGRPLIIIPPSYAPAASAVLVELHGRIGHFPTIARLRLNPDQPVTTYDVVELVKLQQDRDDTRAQER